MFRFANINIFGFSVTMNARGWLLGSQVVVKYPARAPVLMLSHLRLGSRTQCVLGLRTKYGETVQFDKDATKVTDPSILTTTMD